MIFFSITVFFSFLSFLSINFYCNHLFSCCFSAFLWYLLLPFVINFIWFPLTPIHHLRCLINLRPHHSYRYSHSSSSFSPFHIHIHSHSFKFSTIVYFDLFSDIYLLGASAVTLTSQASSYAHTFALAFLSTHARRPHAPSWGQCFSCTLHLTMRWHFSLIWLSHLLGVAFARSCNFLYSPQIHFNCCVFWIRLLLLVSFFILSI